METGWNDKVELSPNCPRCGSSNTKFCYYNNYSLTQPRYFCKGCRRYWTKGGSLRNVPIGGGCRKNQRGKSILRTRHSVYRLAPNESTDHSYGPHVGPPVEPPGPSTVSDGSSIDLALVYANFLNQHPEPRHDHFDEPSEQLNILETENDPESLRHPELSAFKGNYACGLNSIYDQQERIQQITSLGDRIGSTMSTPLPGEGGTRGLDPRSIVSNHTTIEESQLLGIEDVEQDSNLSITNWDLSDFAICGTSPSI